MRYTAKLSSALLLPLLFSSAAFADDFMDFAEEGYFQLRGGAGIGWLSADDTTLGITEFESDTVTFDSSSAAVVTLGLGYVFPLSEEDEDLRWLPAVVTSIDGAYQFETEFSGDVMMYGDPDFNNYNNNTEIRTGNLMFNVTLALVEYQRWTAFILGGAGAAWTQVSYDDEPRSGIPVDSGIDLDDANTTTFAWQGGGGIGFEIMPELDLTLTYLYTDLGDVNTSDDGPQDDDNDLSFTAAEFDLSQQTVVLGLTWNFL